MNLYEFKASLAYIVAGQPRLYSETLSQIKREGGG